LITLAAAAKISGSLPIHLTTLPLYATAPERRMPNIKSAKKRMELSRRANTKNRARRSRIRTAVKKVRQAETAEEAHARLREAIRILDHAATKHLMHANRAARIKSQLARHVREIAS